MKVFIIAKSAVGYSFAKVFASNPKTEKVYLAPAFAMAEEFAEIVDINTSDVQSLAAFAKENAIDLTVVLDETAIANNIAAVFAAHNLDILAPTVDAARIALSKSSCKKFMYKTRVQAPKFGIFDRENLAVEYARKSSFPLLVKLDNHVDGENVKLCTTFSQAKNAIEDAFEAGYKKIIIENYIRGREFSFYILSDGYSALPILSVVPYKYSLSGGGGNITSGLGAYAPNFIISAEIEKTIAQRVVFPILDELNKNSIPYVGIMGIDMILDSSGKIWTIEINTGFNVPDAQCVTALVEDDWYDLIRATLAGSLGDDYTDIKTKDAYVTSVVLSSRGVSDINIPENVKDDLEISFANVEKNNENVCRALGGRAIVATKVAPTLSRARKELYEEIESINFEGKKFLNDIAKTANEIF